MAFKTWWGHQYRVKVAAKNLVVTSHHVSKPTGAPVSYISKFVDFKMIRPNPIQINVTARSVYLNSELTLFLK